VAKLLRVPRAGVTPAELVSVLSRELDPDFQVGGIGPGPGGQDEVMARRSPLSAVVVRIGHVPGATVLRVHGVGMPVVSLMTAHVVAGALRQAPEFAAAGSAAPAAGPGARGQ
jgi:hypothetical protein